MEQKHIDGLVSLVLAAGWRPQLEEVLGTDADAFYDALVEKNLLRAYEVAQASGDALVLDRVTRRVIQHTVGSAALEPAIRDIYINQIPVSVTSSLSIDSLPDKYRIHGVSYCGKESVVDISKVLMDNGVSRTQEDWLRMTKEGEWKLASGPLYFAVLAALYDQRETSSALVEEVKNMFANDFCQNYMITSTRIRYACDGADTVIHNRGYRFEHREQADIVGNNGYICEASGFGSAMRALVGTDACDKVASVLHWVTGKESYLLRFKQKPVVDVECALVLGGDVRFGVFAGGDLGGNWRARGMVVRDAENLHRK